MLVLEARNKQNYEPNSYHISMPLEALTKSMVSPRELASQISDSVQISTSLPGFLMTGHCLLAAGFSKFRSFAK